MNKYFLPVYYSQLKPWIKWWILKRLNGESTLKAVTISSGTLTKVDKSKALSISEYYGNAIQNGTPTPETPVEIQTISGDNTFTINSVNYNLNLKSKQLFNYQYSQLRNINRVTTSEETNGFKLTSTGVAGYGFASLPIDDNLIGKQITISCNSTGNKTPSARLFYHNSSGNLASNIGAFWTTNTAHTVTLPSTLPSGSTGIDIVFYISQGNNAEGDYATFTNIMINEGSTALPYESYYNYELCKIGDYQDKIVNDNGTWKLEKKIGKVVLNGTQNITLTGSGIRRFNATYSTLGITNIKEGTSAQDSTLNYRKCDHFTYISGQTTWGNYYLNGNWLVLLDSESTIANANALKTWFASNPTNIYYVLAEATTETITATSLISQLNALYEFNVNSRTVSISNDSEITLEVLLEYYGR